MNRDSHLIFEAYRQRLEEMAVRLASDKRGEASGTSVTFPPKSAGKYDLSPEQTKEVIERVVAKLEEEGGSSDLSDKDFQRVYIAPVIAEVAKKNMTNATYAARVIHTALKGAGVLTAERGEVTLDDATPEAQEQAADDVPEVAAENPPTAAEQSPNSGEASHGTADAKFNPIEHAVFKNVDNGISEREVIERTGADLRNGGKEVEADLIKKAIDKLVAHKVLERRGQFLEFGDGAESYEKEGDNSLVNADPDEYLAARGIHGGRPTQGRHVFGGEGGGMSEYFG